MRVVLLLPVLLVASAAAGCVRAPDDGQASPTPSPAPEANACTNLAAPSWDATSRILQGAHAFAYVVGLVCDHAGVPIQERARVPGTPGQEAGAAYLKSRLEAAGWAAQRQEFTGAQYDSIMQDRGGTHAQWWNSCSADQLVRMRGLPFVNVEGRYGTGSGIVILMAHYDSKRFADDDPDPAKRDRPVLGANDGASGVGVLLELARVLGKETPNTSLQYRILFTDGEDGFDDCHPLAGSTYYAERLSAADRNLVRGILLLDMVGDPNAQFYRGCGTDEALAGRIWREAAQQDVRQFKDEIGCGIVDDHTPFENRGMKTVDVIDFRRGEFPPYWHTAGDTPDKLSPDLLGAVGRVVHSVLKAWPLAP